jgi:hypothetical protein
MVSAPTISPSAETYAYGSAGQVTLANSTSAATIYYTTDGTTPTYPVTGTTQQYTGPFAITQTEIVKAIAAKANYVNSPVATSGLFTIKLVQPSFSTTNGGQVPATYMGSMSAKVVLTNTYPAATICYTTDNITPTANTSGVCTNGTALVPGGTFTLSGMGTYYVKAIAAAANFATRNLVSGTYVLQVAPPAFSNVGAQYPGTYTGSAIVKLTNTDPAATICYTTNNTTPTANTSGVCTNGTALVPGGTFTLTGTGTHYVKAVAAAVNSIASTMVSGTYVLN